MQERKKHDPAKIKQAYRELVLPDHTYQPSKAEMEETFRFDGTLEQFAQALFRPVRVRRIKNWKKCR